MGKFLIIPGCDDGNRGDQALVWETKRFAEAAGFVGDYQMLCEEEDLMHSKMIGITTIRPILRHPGRTSKKIDNSKYSGRLLLQWGIQAGLDLCYSLFLKNGFTRKCMIPFLKQETRQAIKAFEECDACFVKGGGFIHSYGKITDIYTIYYFLYHIRLAQAMKKKVYIFPNSFGPFLAPTVKGQVERALKKCTFVSARESRSMEALRSIGVEAKQYPDLGFALPKSNAVISELNEIENIANGRKLVAITARPYRFPSSSDPEQRYEEYMQALTSACKWIYEEGYFPVLTEHVLARNKNESDICCIEEIAARLDKGSYYIFSNTSYNCQNMKEFYSHMYAVIGTRFHSVIFSLSEQIPCIAITYGGNKGMGIMEDIGLQEYAIAIEDVTFEKIKVRFSELMNKYTDYKVLLSHVSEINQVQYADLITELKRSNDE